MHRKHRSGNLGRGAVGVLLFFLIFAVSFAGYDMVTKRLPIAQSHSRLAQEGITRNEDWKPVIRQFDKMDWALVPVGCFRIGSTEFQLEEALKACKTYGGDNCPYVFDQVAQPDSQVCFEKPYWITITEVTNREYGSSSSTDKI